MVNQEKKMTSTFSFAPIIKGTLFGIFMMLVSVFIGAILILNQAISLECLPQTAMTAVSVGFFSAAFITSAASKNKKMLCGVAACCFMTAVFALLGLIMPESTFSVSCLIYVVIAALICSAVGSMLAVLLKKK